MSAKDISDLHIVIAQMRVTPGDVRANVKRIISEIGIAKSADADMIVFPELCTTGYLIGDRFEYPEFLEEVTAANLRIAEATQGIIAIFGSVQTEPRLKGEDGRERKYNAAFVALNGEIVRTIPKTNMPNYRMFDDKRQFTSARQVALEHKDRIIEVVYPVDLLIRGETYRVSITICEDLWCDDYDVNPALIARAAGSDLLINISCSPWATGKVHARERMLAKRAREAECPILYVNAVGLQNNVKNLVWFDGGSTMVDADGNVIHRSSQHISTREFSGSGITELVAPIVELHDATVHAMRDFYTPFNKVVIGLSGGIDSAVAAACLASAIGPERILAVNMPTEYNSKTIQDLAAQCAKNLGIEYIVVPIQEEYELAKRNLAAAGFNNPNMLVLENLQSRIRGNKLLTIAQAVGGVVSNNANKTEIALNYFTLHGDSIGAASFFGDDWKGEVYELAYHINRESKIIPQGIIDLIPSAELSAEQNVDQGKGDPIFYPYHDKLLAAFTERRVGPHEVLVHLQDGTIEAWLGCKPGTITHYFPTRLALIDNLEWSWKNYNTEFKRAFTPPIFITSRRAFGFDRRDTIAAYPLSESYEELKEKLLLGN
jgi:NAD+ synthase (glutamine-hydrolysing)